MKTRIVMALVALMCAAMPVNSQTLKTVTYSFTGSVLKKSEPIGLKASGSIPAGVVVGKSNSCGWGMDPENGVTPHLVDIHNWDKKLFGGLTTLYVTHTNEESEVYFHNFKYEIYDIQWKRRSQIRALTSKGETWATRWDGTALGYHNFVIDEDEEEYTTSGELLYHKRSFIDKVAQDGTTPIVPFSGLKTLHVKVNSKAPMHAIAVQAFEIQYAVPEPLITRSDDPDGEGYYTVNVTIGKDQHVGAFTASDLELRYNTSLFTDVQTIKKTQEGDKIVAQYRMKPDLTKYGSATVSAIVMNGDEIAGQSSTTISVDLSSADWSWTRDAGNVYCEINHTASGFKDNTYYDASSALRIQTIFNDDFASDKNVPTNWNKLSILTTANTSNQKRIGVQKVYYNQQVPAWTEMEIGFDYYAMGDRSVDNDTKLFGVEIKDLGSTFYNEADLWPDGAKTAANRIRFSQNEEEIYNDYGQNGKQVVRRINSDTFNNKDTWVGTGTFLTRDVEVYSSKHWTSINTSYPSSSKYYFKLDNKKQSTANSDMSSRLMKENFTVSVFHNTQYGGTARSLTFTGKFAYKERVLRSKYYAYITFDRNVPKGATKSGEDMAVQEMYSTSNWETTNASNLAPTTGLAQSLATNTFGCSKTNGIVYNYVFLGWNTKKDGTGDWYADGADFVPYDCIDGEYCGKGHITLYAQWQDTEQDFAVTYIANGGSITGASAEMPYVKDLAVKYGASAAAAPVASKPGYDFAGYYSEPEGAGTLVANASGVIQTSNNFVDASGNWIITSDVTFYAHFTINPTKYDEIKHTLTFHANGGTLPAKVNGSAWDGTLEVLNGSDQNNNVSDYTPTAPTGKVFAGWFTDGGEMVYNANGQAIELYEYDEETGIVTYRAYNNKYWTNLGEWQTTASDLDLYARWVDNGTMYFYEKQADGGHFNEYSEGEIAPTAVMTRTIKVGTWNTVCFPFSLSEEQTSNLFSQVKVLSSVTYSSESDVLSLHFGNSDVIKGGVPYFVQVKDGATGAVYTGSGSSRALTSFTVKDVTLTQNTSTIKCGAKANDQVVMLGMEGSFVTVSPMKDGSVYMQSNKFWTSGKEYIQNGTPKKITGNNLGYRVTYSISDTEKGDLLNLDLEESGWDLGNVETTDIVIPTNEGYGTYYNPTQNIIMPDGLMGAAAGINGKYVSWEWNYEGGAVVPAGTPILVWGEKGTYRAVVSAEEGIAPAINALHANTGNVEEKAKTIAGDDEDTGKYYVLTYNSTGTNLGFYWRMANGSGDFYVPAGKVFLVIPTQVQASPRFTLFMDDDETAIEAPITDWGTAKTDNLIYDLYGRRLISEPQKGIYIKNGKKFFVK